jgi:tRNA threonylcarbamoyladenosine biosynthesis protein TsaB
MRLLSVDTTSRWASVALFEEGEVRGEVGLGEDGGHSCTILPAVDSLLRLLGMGPGDVDAYAAAVGPGSFTGVRVGVSTVQGLALASGRPCVAVTSLEALAAQMRDAAPVLVPMIDAYREDQVFAARYDARLALLDGPRSVAPEEFLETVPAGAAFLGDGARRYRARIESLRPDAVFPERSPFLASAVALVGRRRLAEGGGVPAAELRPLYLRAADIRPAPVTPTASGR